jgi:Cof subfamily protein (haloacid dehalogenase superfamily)
MGVKLVALDIDGTILPPGCAPDAVPSRRLVSAIRSLTDCGARVVLASGRMFPGTASIARHFGLTTPVICQQGCSVHEIDGRMLHEVTIDLVHATAIVAYARELGRTYEWFNPLRYIASSKTAETEEYARLSGIVAEYQARPEESGLRPTGVGIISSHTEAREIHRELTVRHGDDLHVLDFPSVTVAVDARANKGHALDMLARDFGIERHDVVAVGDSVNDAPMLAWAGRGVAMPHADAYAMEAADEVVTHNGPDALAAFLETLVPAASRS